jgi:hypothetical protein
VKAVISLTKLLPEGIRQHAQSPTHCRYDRHRNAEQKPCEIPDMS